MKTVLRKLGKILLWGLAVVLAVYAVAQVADLAWYRLRFPDGFQNANWSGKWESEVYGSIGGRLLVRLPDPIPENEDFQAQAMVYYPIYSLYKTGEFVPMDFTGRLSTGSSSTGGQTEAPIPGKLSFKGMIGKQTIDYVAIVNDGRQRIVGSYLSRDPGDHGLFSLRRN